VKKCRILVLVHLDLIPPPDIKAKDIDRESSPPWLTEYDVIEALKKLGHIVFTLGVYSELIKIRKAIEEFRPHLIFNLLEEFDGETLFDSHVVSHLELLRMAYSGCNPRGLMLSRDKALAKKIMNYHRILSPKFAVYPRSKKNHLKTPPLPAIVKCLSEEASLGLGQASVVNSKEKLQERVQYINQKIGVDAIAEEFVEGREFYVGVIGNHRLQVLPVWELLFSKVENPEQEIYSRQAKWNKKYRQRKGIKSAKADLPPALEKRFQALAKRVYRTLDLSGYARIDLRMNPDGKIYVIEANPNPNVAKDDEFALSWMATNKTYGELLQKIIALGLNWRG
jgi:D-alanine-D-alanine ligase